MKKFSIILFTLFAAVGCIKPSGGNEEVPTAADAVFVACQGNWGSANATLSCYDPEAKSVENGVFYRANSARFGDTAQSLTMHEGTLYAVINNSGVVYAIDPETNKVGHYLDNLTSPRYVAIASPTKGYISTLNPDYSSVSNDIVVFNPTTMTTIKTIKIAGVTNTEQMVVVGDKLYVACWTYGKKLAIVDTTDDTVSTVEVGYQPCSMAVADGKVWVVCDEGFDANWTPAPNGTLWNIDTATGKATKCCDVAKAGGKATLFLASTGDHAKLFMLNGDVCRIDTSTGATTVTVEVDDKAVNYGFAIDPVSGDFYVADAVDYAGDGRVLRYSAEGVLTDTFNVGISPSSFAFK